jgi:hypothetical protein
LPDGDVRRSFDPPWRSFGFWIAPVESRPRTLGTIAKANADADERSLNVRRDNSELVRYLTIFALSSPAAIAVWFVFHGVFVNLSETERVTGYVDSVTQMGIYLGYAGMFGGTLVFAGLALWAAARAFGVWLSQRNRP